MEETKLVCGSAIHCPGELPLPLMNPLGDVFMAVINTPVVMVLRNAAAILTSYHPHRTCQSLL